MTEKKIVIIGAGVSGLLCGKRLTEAGHSVLILDKGRNIGGRLSTRRTDGAVFHHGASSLPDFYSHNDLPEFGLEIFKRAEKEKIIQRKENLFEPINSVSEFVNYCGTNLNIRESCEAISLNLQNKTIGLQCRGGVYENKPYDLLILSIPPNQAKTLINRQINKFDDLLEGVRMRSSAAALFSFDLNPEPIKDKYFSNEKVCIQVENNRFKCNQQLFCLTVHTKEPFAKKVVKTSKNQIKDILLKELSDTIPFSLPKPIYEAGHRWLYGFTERSLGKSYLFYNKENVGICGDWCLGGTILDAASSGIRLAEEILTH
jgi:renalase